MFDFLSLRKSIEPAQDKYRKLSAELRALDLEILMTTHAPANRKDVIDSVETWVNQSAEKFTSAVVSMNIRKYQHGSVPPYTAGFFGLFGNDSNVPTKKSDEIPHMDICMCALFGDQIKNSIATAIGKMSWPDEGLPIAERRTKVESLEARRNEVRSEIAAMRDNAHLAGVDL